MGGQEEKRKFARLNILVDVSYKKRESLKIERLTVTKNIGKGGICFVGYEALKESDIIDMNIFLPGEKSPMRITGKVVWVKEFVIGEPSRGTRYDVGVEFINIAQGDLEKVEKYMGKHTG